MFLSGCGLLFRALDDCFCGGTVNVQNKKKRVQFLFIHFVWSRTRPCVLRKTKKCSKESEKFLEQQLNWKIRKSIRHMK